MLDFLAGAVGIIGSGGLTGILGGGLQLLFGWLNARAEIDKMKVQAQLQVDLIRAQSEADQHKYAAMAKIEEKKAEGIAAKADSEALMESHKAAEVGHLHGLQPPKNRFIGAIVYLLMGIMEAFRAFIRPGLTVYLAVITTYLWYEADQLVKMLGVEWRQDIAEKVYIQIVFTLLYLFGVCVAWWFVSRKVPNIFSNGNGLKLR